MASVTCGLTAEDRDQMGLPLPLPFTITTIVLIALVVLYYIFVIFNFSSFYRVFLCSVFYVYIEIWAEMPEINLMMVMMMIN